MSRSPLWCAAFVGAWRELRDTPASFEEVSYGERTWARGVPHTPQSLRAACVAEADTCEAVYLSAEDT